MKIYNNGYSCFSIHFPRRTFYSLDNGGSISCKPTLSTSNASSFSLAPLIPSSLKKWIIQQQPFTVQSPFSIKIFNFKYHKHILISPYILHFQPYYCMHHRHFQIFSPWNYIDPITRPYCFAAFFWLIQYLFGFFPYVAG